MTNQPETTSLESFQQIQPGKSGLTTTEVVAGAALAGAAAWVTKNGVPTQEQVQKAKDTVVGIAGAAAIGGLLAVSYVPGKIAGAIYGKELRQELDK